MTELITETHLSTSELTERVMKQWQPPAYYVLTEVRNGTGYSKAEGCRARRGEARHGRS